MFELPPLPYEKTALAPFLSEETLTFHHDKHFNAYVTTLNTLIKDTPYAELSLEEIIRKAAAEDNKPIFNNAGQVFNHDFYFKCLGPAHKEGEGDACPLDGCALKKMVGETFGGREKFWESLVKAATGNFGSGWTWLVQENGKLEILNYSNADSPVRDRPSATPLLCIDVWEHAYYIDYRNDRKKYVEQMLQHVNWVQVASRVS